MNLKRLLLKPEYYFRPQQVIRRLSLNDSSSVGQTHLMWGHENFELNPQETIGKSILSYGLYDLALTEAIYRLLNKDSLCLDIGANIGYFTSLMSSIAQEVHAFEPHPQIFKRLKKNCEALKNVQCHPLALAQEEGEAELYVPKNFEKNEGISSLVPNKDADKITIQTQCLDNLFPSEKIHLIKMDVEGHELAVLEGAQQLLSQGRIDHIVFEDFEGSSSPVVKKLQDYGYQVFRLTKGFLNLKVLKMNQADQVPLWEPPNYWATKKEMNWNQNKFWQIFKIRHT